MVSPVKVVTLNVSGLRNARKRKYIFQILKRKKVDIACLQESYITENDAKQWEKEWGGNILFCEGSNHGRGQLILINKRFQYEWRIERKEERILNIIINAEKEISLFNIYAPCGQRETKEFFANLIPIIKNSDAQIKIVCGDFNAVMSNEKDIISGEKKPPSLVQAFNELAEICELYDLWRILNEDIKEYTWSRYRNGKFIARRLDYFLLNEAAVDTTSDISNFSVPSTDHRGVEIMIKCSESKRGPGYYKFNNSLLDNDLFVNKMNSIIDTFLTENVEQNPVLKLELLKLKLKEESIQFSKLLATKRRNNEVDLYQKLDICETALAKDPDNLERQVECKKIKFEIEILEQNRIKGFQIRSKQKFIADGDKNTKLLFNLEKNRSSTKIIPSLQLDNGESVTDQFDILKAQRDYYHKLYNKYPDESNMDEKIDTFLKDCHPSKLTDTEKNSCEGMITLDEAYKALSLLNNGSSPGPDGLTAEFYKRFWPIVGKTVVDSFNESFKDGHLSFTQSSALLTLLHKGKELPKNKLNNWRPISLTNTDYKILAKCLANRVSKVIDNIVAEDQVGYIKGRNVSTSLRTIDDIINFYNLKKRPGIILALDFQKAFDSISKQFMIGAFKKFGFGTDMLQWIKVVFADTKSNIIYNGWTSESFNVTNGIRQGCPFSPLAFIIGVELLAIRLRESKEIQGLNIDVQNIIKTLLYADDITVFLKDVNDVKATIAVLKEFSQISALYLNLSKSEAMGIGISKGIRHDLGVKWVNEIKVLGIYFKNDKSASENDKNWTERVAKIKQLIKQWEKWNLGIWGKLCLIKSLLLSQIIYTMQAICIPDTTLREINTLLYRFLWRKKDVNKRAFEKVKRVVLNADYEKGGINMIDVTIMQESLLCKWFYDLLIYDKPSKWTLIPMIFFKKFGKDLSCFSSRSGSKSFKGLDLIKIQFWKKVATTWLQYNKDSGFFSTKMTCIWNNDLITYQNKMIFLENWAQKITYVNDLIVDNRIKSLEEIELIIGPSPNLVLEYITVRSAVLTFIKKNNYVDTLFDQKDNWNIFQLKHKVNAKLFRRDVNNRNFKEPCSIRFWYNKFSISINEKTWKIAYDVTQESRLRELQWKILHNIYPTNILLQKMGILTTNKCSYCLNEIDYIEHFFFECKKVRPLWKHVEHLVSAKLGYNIRIEKQDVLLGWNKEIISKKYFSFINHAILIGKMCVGKFRYGKALELIFTFDNELKLRGVT